MQFVFPNLEYKERAQDFIHEFYVHGSAIHGSGSLDEYLEHRSYEDWVRKVRADIDIANVPLERVPALTYFYVRDEDSRVIGMVNIRLALNEYLAREGGHIGYCIRPTERRKHYASRMLKEALRCCRRIGLTHIVLCCDKPNTVSASVIRNCGGRLECEFYSEDSHCVVQRYVVSESI